MANKEGLFNDYMTKQEFCDSIPGGPIAPNTADHWHRHKIGPPRIRIGNVILYPKAGVQEWLDRLFEKAQEDLHDKR